MKTIAAISTPMGHGGIGIVRISGDKSLEIISKVFNPKNEGELKPYTIKFGNIVDEQGIYIDQVLVSYFKAPKTYTGEDICEINCHGGLIVTKQILELVLRNGAELAKPGEFTERAFLNGKIDLTQAEAVMDLINSKSAKEKSVSLKQLEGYLGKKIKEIKDEIIDLLVDIEANIDYPEYDVPEIQKEKVVNVLNDAIYKIEKLEKTFESGKILKEGVNTAIVGKPNVGKSSLLNALLRENRAIVTEVAGTTRDTIEEYVTIKGIPLKLIDTAGIRETTDIVENIGIEKSKNAIEESELVLLLLDASSGLCEEDNELLRLIKSKKHIVLINKIDMQSKINFNDINDENIIEISVKNDVGLDKLEDKIEEIFAVNTLETDDNIMITNVRHQTLILNAKKELKNAIDSVNNDIPLDMLSIDISNAIQNLGEITGEAVSEDVIKGIFAKFCLGK
ncbi:MAG: tRNA uridine-5-carboxymethylaminomethyl(34) synthesis GTPase MnmE [Clostridia bacterium]|nr:tRNA uridine-5-carboxymethylaminomethyl(34) synthesis GTPase MnmE [Clostridia bacterium]